MSDPAPSSPPADPQAAIQLLQAELAETNREMLLLTLELDARVEARTAELQIAHQQLEKTNAELLKVALNSNGASKNAPRRSARARIAFGAWRTGHRSSSG